jgi:signal transduction histidine kinase
MMMAQRTDNELDRLSAQIRQAKLEWEATVDALPQVVCLLDTEGLIVRANRAVERWGIGPVQQVKGRPLHDLIHPQCADPAACEFNALWRHGWEAMIAGQPAEFEACDETAQRHLLVQIHPLQPGRREERRGTASFAAALVHDITERKRAEENLARLFDEVRAGREQLQTLSRKLMEVQEVERRAIARELHDEIGQDLTAIKINLQAAQQVSAEQAPFIQDCVAIVEHTLQQVRNLSLELRPSMLDDLGLVPALRWYVNRTAQRSGFEAEFISELPEQRLPPVAETTCFRVIQTALTNVARHANATRVQVRIEQSGAVVCLTIRDNGAGFDVASARARAIQGASLGLLSMEERVVLAGGQFEIESAIGHGTEVRARLPADEP